MTELDVAAHIPWSTPRLLAQIVRAMATWRFHDTQRPSPVPENPRFMSARAAAALVRDGDVLAVSGLGGNQRASIVFWAIREAFETTGHPADLTLVNLGGHGGRGRAPGTLEELGRRGLCRRLVTGHFETYRAMLDLAAAGACELQCIPQGTLALLIAALGRGETSLWSPTGVGTFIDPRVGSGSRVGGVGEQLVVPDGAGLRYRMPPIDVALFNAPAADRLGNIYVRHCAMIGETAEIARAAKRNGGRVIANVGLLVEPGFADVYVPADMIDAIVHHPDTEQAAGIFHRWHWPALTTESTIPIAEARRQADLVSWLSGLTPERSAVDDAVARLAAATLVAHVPAGGYVNIGTGYPEHACRALCDAGMHERYTLLVESGPIGGAPAGGIFFGASFSPRRIVSSAEMFALCRDRLDATCLGALEVDAAGNVNVSRRSESCRDYVGPGGFIDLSTAARTIVFACDWTRNGAFALRDGCVRLVRRGAPKFVARVREITFDGPRALAAGKQVFYATPVGLFRLTARGVELAQVMPGIDVRRDVLDVAAMPIVVPGNDGPPLVPWDVVAGDGFAARLAAEAFGPRPHATVDGARGDDRASHSAWRTTRPGVTPAS